MTTKRQLAAQVMLQHRLNNLLRISDTVEIDTSYITCAEYQLFIDDKLKQSEYRQPDHWTDTRFPKGDARNPITGVRFSDAEEFCKWLSSYDATRLGCRYRLPTAAEAEQYPIESKRESGLGQAGTWCKGKAPLVVGVERQERERINGLLLDLELDLARDFDRVDSFARAYAYDRDRGLANTSDIARARTRALILAQAFDLDLDLGNTRDHYLVRGFVRDLGRDLARARDLARDLDLAHARDLDLARIHSLDLARADILVVYYLYISQQPEKVDPDQRIRLARGYLNLVFISERIAGNLPAWEGIRIVRERIPDNEIVQAK